MLTEEDRMRGVDEGRERKKTGGRYGEKGKNDI